MGKIFNLRNAYYIVYALAGWGALNIVKDALGYANTTVENFNIWMITLIGSAIIIILAVLVFQNQLIIKLMQGKKPTYRITSKEDEEPKKLN